MGLKPFFFGLIISLPLVLLCLKIFRGRFLGIANRYFAGVLYAFWIWAIAMILLYLEVRFEVVGLASGEEGFGLIAVFTSSVRGFLTGGLAAGFFSGKLSL